jgi:YesN/AraC family two-component response regulator
VSISRDKHWRALIVDDEELARYIIREMLQSHPEIEIAAECANGMEAVKAVAEHKPSLIFLDVQMPKLTGFDVLELIGTDVPVIFVTAYDEYAMRAFDVHAVDYLLKPIGRERFDAAVERAKNRLGEKTPAPTELAAAARPPQQFLERLVVKDGTKVTLNSCWKARLCRSTGRLRGTGDAGKKASQAANHCRPGSLPQPGQLCSNSSLLHRESGARCAH